MPDGRGEGARPWRARAAAAARTAIPLALLVAAGVALHRELARFDLRDVRAAVHAVPAWRILAAIALAGANYALLTLYDVLALRHVGRPLPYAAVGPAAFVAYAFGHNLGASVATGGGVRYRFYSAAGLGALEVTQVVLFTSLTFAVGFLAVGGVVLLAAPGAGLPSAIPAPLLRGAGALLLALFAAYVVLCATVRRPLVVRGVALRLPRPRLAAVQVALGAADWVLAASVPWALLPGEPLGFLSFAVLFAAAHVAALLSQVPGGLGVFETVMMAALTPRVPAPTVLAVLVLYRLAYYLVPFVAAALLLAAGEALRRRRAAGRLARAGLDALAPAIPAVAAIAAAVAGGVLLLAGAVPAPRERLHLVGRLPLPLLEASHLLGSVAGMALLLVARGLERRVDAAWAAAVGLLAAGAALSVVRGLGVEEAVLLLLLLAALLPFRAQFHRRSSLLAEPFGARWAAAVAAVTGASLWLGVFAHRHAVYREELFWKFALHADAPRFLRASVAAVAVALAAGLAHLLRPARRRAAAGDVLEDPARGASLPYAISGGTVVGLGGGAGPADAAAELAWRLRDVADARGARLAFAGVGRGEAARFLELGLELVAPEELSALDAGAARALRALVDGLGAPGEERLLALPPGRALARAAADVAALAARRTAETRNGR